MLDSLKSKMRRLGVGWYWPLVLLALADCALATEGLPRPNQFEGGDPPLSSAVMCDIPDLEKPDWECVPEAEDPMGIRVEEAAIALATTQQHVFKLDFSDLAACPGNQPKRRKVMNLFPDGTTVCLNCDKQLGQGKTFADANAVCVAECLDVFTNNVDTPPPGGVLNFCAENARASVNFPLHSCFEGACTMGGNPDPNFPDPRRDAEPVVWTDFGGGAAATMGNSLTRNTPSGGAGLAGFDAGAASTKAIFTQSGWVEFSTAVGNLDAILGVTFAPGYPNAVDGDPTGLDIGFGLMLHQDGNIYIVESGAVLNTGPGPNGSFGTYSAGDRFRIHVTDNLDVNGTATIKYSHVDNACFPHNPCNEPPIYTSLTTSKYPLRVDAAIRAQNAIIQGVTLVRIQEQQ